MGPKHQQLPIWRDATRMLVEIEQAVRRFPRYHKYTLGSELRRYFCRRFPGAVVFVGVGNRIEAYGPHVGRIAALPNHGGQMVTRAGLAPALAWKPEQTGTLRRRLTGAGIDWVETAEAGWLKGGLKRRVLGRWSVTAATAQRTREQA